MIPFNGRALPQILTIRTVKEYTEMNKMIYENAEFVGMGVL